MKAKKQAGIRLDTGAYVAEFTDWEDDPNLKNKKGVTCPAFKFRFEIADIEGQEDYAGAQLSKTLWYKLDDQGEVIMGTKAFQVLEALQSEEVEHGSESAEFDDLIGNFVVLQVTAPETDVGFADIVRIDPYTEESAVPKHSRRPSPRPAPSRPTTRPVGNRPQPKPALKPATRPGVKPQSKSSATAPVEKDDKYDFDDDSEF